MSKLQIDGTALAVSVLAVAFGLTLLMGPFAWLASIAGLVLAIVLLGYDREGYRSVLESLGFSAVVALCLTLASAVLLRIVAVNPGQPAGFEGRIGGEWMPLIWIGLTILVTVIDRTRMSGRVQYPASPVTAAPPPSFSFAPLAPTPPSVAVRPVVTESPAPMAQPSAPQPPLRPTFTQPSFGQAIDETMTEPIAQMSVPTPRPAAAAPAPVFAASAAPTFTPVTETPAPLPPTSSPSLPAGKPAMIYVSLMGEGLNVLRAVGAEHLGRDYYKIVEEMPEGETWEFGPGQVVRCKKKNLSSGKAMVATEEAPRTR